MSFLIAGKTRESPEAGTSRPEIPPELCHHGAVFSLNSPTVISFPGSLLLRVGDNQFLDRSMCFEFSFLPLIDPSGPLNFLPPITHFPGIRVVGPFPPRCQVSLFSHLPPFFLFRIRKVSCAWPAPNYPSCPRFSVWRLV